MVGEAEGSPPRENLMEQMNKLFAFLVALTYCGMAMGQTGAHSRVAVFEPSSVAAPHELAENVSPLDAQRERHALQIFLKSVEKKIVSAAEAMPADKYSFTPSNGEFKGVRSFGEQVKHLSATNHILAAAALDEKPPVDAGDETGPENVRTKAEILDYLNSSFVHLGKAIDAIGSKNSPVRASPISPLPAEAATRSALATEALIHAFDHYGQMVVYLRLNGVVPPASRP
jgi:uncharacterized damage-inducible protein DinB